MSNAARRSKLQVCLLVSGAAVGMMVATAPAASAAPSDKAGCVAQVVDSPAGPPGLSQREVREPRFGGIVSFVARIAPEDCFFEQ